MIIRTRWEISLYRHVSISGEADYKYDYIVLTRLQNEYNEEHIVAVP